MDNIIVIHGSFGKADSNWFPWLKNSLPSRVIVPQFPVGVGKQSYDSWQQVLDIYHKKGMITNDTILICCKT